MNKNELEQFDKCKARYVSDIKSIFFKKGEIYDAYIPKCSGGKGMLAFHFTEEEMDEDGMYALPAERFEIVE